MGLVQQVTNMNAYEVKTIADAQIAQQLLDLLESLDLQTSATWEVYKLQELINSRRSIGEGLVSARQILSIAEACLGEYTKLPSWPEISYVQRVKLTVELTERYTAKLIGA